MNISEELIREIITKVVESAASEKKASDCGFEKHIDPSGIIGIKTSTVKCEPFEQDGIKGCRYLGRGSAHGLWRDGTGSHQL